MEVLFIAIIASAFSLCVTGFIGMVCLGEMKSDMQKMKPTGKAKRSIVKATVLIVFVLLNISCAVSNKRHSQIVHPYGYWSGKGWHANPDSVKSITTKK